MCQQPSPFSQATKMWSDGNLCLTICKHLQSIIIQNLVGKRPTRKFILSLLPLNAQAFTFHFWAFSIPMLTIFVMQQNRISFPKIQPNGCELDYHLFILKSFEDNQSTSAQPRDTLAMQVCNGSQFSTLIIPTSVCNYLGLRSVITIQ